MHILRSIYTALVVSAASSAMEISPILAEAMPAQAKQFRRLRRVNSARPDVVVVAASNLPRRESTRRSFRRAQEQDSEDDADDDDIDAEIEALVLELAKLDVEQSNLQDDLEKLDELDEEIEGEAEGEGGEIQQAQAEPSTDDDEDDADDDDIDAEIEALAAELAKLDEEQSNLQADLEKLDELDEEIEGEAEGEGGEIQQAQAEPSTDDDEDDADGDDTDAEIEALTAELAKLDEEQSNLQAELEKLDELDEEIEDELEEVEGEGGDIHQTQAEAGPADSIQAQIDEAKQQCAEGSQGMFMTGEDGTSERDAEMIRMKCCLPPFDKQLPQCFKFEEVRAKRAANKCDLLEMCLEVNRLKKLSKEGGDMDVPDAITEAEPTPEDAEEDISAQIEQLETELETLDKLDEEILNDLEEEEGEVDQTSAGDDVQAQIEQAQQKCDEGSKGIFVNDESGSANQRDEEMIRMKCCLPPYGTELPQCRKEFERNVKRAENNCNLLEMCLEVDRLKGIASGTESGAALKNAENNDGTAPEPEAETEPAAVEDALEQVEDVEALAIALKEMRRECSDATNALPPGFMLQGKDAESIDAINEGCCFPPYPEASCTPAIPAPECDAFSKCQEVDRLGRVFHEMIQSDIETAQQRCDEGFQSMFEDGEDGSESKRDSEIIKIECCLPPYHVELRQCHEEEEVQALRAKNNCGLLESCFEVHRLENIQKGSDAPNLDFQSENGLADGISGSPPDLDYEGYHFLPHQGGREGGKKYDYKKKEGFNMTEQFLGKHPAYKVFVVTNDGPNLSSAPLRWWIIFGAFVGYFTFGL